MKWPELKFEQLVHLSEDPKELKDVKKEYPEVLKEMKLRHDVLQKEVV